MNEDWFHTRMTYIENSSGDTIALIFTELRYFFSLNTYSLTAFFEMLCLSRYVSYILHFSITVDIHF